MSKILLSINPGSCTGFAEATWNEHANDVTIIRVGKWSSDDRLHALLGFGLFARVHTCIIGSCDIRPRASKATIDAALQMSKATGKVEWICHECNLWHRMHGGPGIEIVYQMPSVAKQQWPDKRMRQYAAYSHSEYVCDALRHLFTYIEQKNRRQHLKIHFDVL